jgi:hypothetical protein
MAKREKAREARAEARRKRREQFADVDGTRERSRPQLDVAEKTRTVGQKVRDVGARAREVGGRARDASREIAETGTQRAKPKTVATAAAVGASLGAVVLAGRKIFSSKGSSEGE